MTKSYVAMCALIVSLANFSGAHAADERLEVLTQQQSNSSDTPETGAQRGDAKADIDDVAIPNSEPLTPSELKHAACESQCKQHIQYSLKGQVLDQIAEKKAKVLKLKMQIEAMSSNVYKAREEAELYSEQLKLEAEIAALEKTLPDYDKATGALRLDCVSECTTGKKLEECDLSCSLSREGVESETERRCDYLQEQLDHLDCGYSPSNNVVIIDVTNSRPEVCERLKDEFQTTCRQPPGKTPADQYEAKCLCKCRRDFDMSTGFSDGLTSGTCDDPVNWVRFRSCKSQEAAAKCTALTLCEEDLAPDDFKKCILDLKEECPSIVDVIPPRIQPLNPFPE